MNPVELVAVLTGLVAVVCIFVVLPALILNFLVKLRASRNLSPDDSRMLEDLWRSAREIERRIETLERLVEPDGRQAETRTTYKHRPYPEDQA